jgi:RimJ/RimL family protein N-acetyltransferase
MYPVQLKGSQVTLREFRADDLDRVMTVVGDDRVTKTLSFDSRSTDQAATMLKETLIRAEQEPRTEYYLAIAVAGAGLAGFARLGLNGVRAAKLGCAVAADYWGRGYAADATHTMVDFGFRTLKLHRVSAAIGPDNLASIAVVRKLGMTYEGRIRDHVHTNGNWAGQPPLLDPVRRVDHRRGTIPRR